MSQGCKLGRKAFSHPGRFAELRPHWWKQLLEERILRSENRQFQLLNFKQLNYDMILSLVQQDVQLLQQTRVEEMTGE
uniref:Uncharacterized protein n=1 Tax=Arundo donax TaxID=35708 RepID=A0A0A8YXK0_ARUDO